MLVYALTARSASPDEYGRLTTILAWVTVASGVAVWGSNLVAARNVATEVFDITQFRDWLRSRMSIFGIGAALLVGPVTALILESPLAGAGLATFFWLINGTGAVGAWFLGHREFRTLFVAGAAARMILVAVTVLLIVDDRLSADVLPVLLGGSLLVEALLLYVKLPRGREGRRFVNPWSGALTVGAATSASGLQQLDTPVVAAVAGDGQAGFYSAVLRWTNPMTLLPTAFAGASLSQVAAARTGRELREVYFAGLRLVPIQLVVGALLWAFADILVNFVLGPAYSESAVVLRILLIGTLPRMLCDPLFVTLQTRGAERWALLSVLLYTCALMIGVGLGGSIDGAAGAAVGWGLAQLVFLISLLVGVFTRMSVKRSGAEDE